MPTLDFDLFGAGVDVSYAGGPTMYGSFDPSTKSIFRLVGGVYLDVQYLTTDCTANTFGNNQQASCIGRVTYTDGNVSTTYVLRKAVVNSTGGGNIRLVAIVAKVPM